MGGKPRVAPAPSRSTGRRIRAMVEVLGGISDAPLYLDAPTALEGGPRLTRIAVRGRLAGAEFTGAFVPLGGKRRLLINQALATASGVYAGARVSLEVERVIDPALEKRTARREGVERVWILD